MLMLTDAETKDTADGDVNCARIVSSTLFSYNSAIFFILFAPASQSYDVYLFIHVRCNVT
jgi:hypothetical protein